ncbi:hypothetical protein PO124_08385 [Bacillus licheniformis]|nr:hypothetical protein [Bacillus licheniformis]
MLRDGSFITKDKVYTDGICYDKSTGEPSKDKKAVSRTLKSQTGAFILRSNHLRRLAEVYDSERLKSNLTPSQRRVSFF